SASSYQTALASEGDRYHALLQRCLRSLVALLLWMTTFLVSSIKLPARTARVRFALLLRPRPLGEIPALLAAAYPTMRPQALKNHFRGSSCGPCIFAIVDAQPSDVIQQSLNFRQLLVTFARRCQLGKFQLAAQFKPLRDRLKTEFRESLAEHSSYRRAYQ